LTDFSNLSRIVQHMQALDRPEHCLENPGFIPLVMIEVQTGSYLGATSCG
jgi:hypothetical protein